MTDSMRNEESNLGLCRTKNDKPNSRKKQKLVPIDIYLENLPSCEAYEKSYMHREILSHITMSSTHFLITCAVDGSLKFWNKTASGIEFVKTFKCHQSLFQDVAITYKGGELVTISPEDKIANIFDVINFDMINFLQLDFEPCAVEWISSSAVGDLNLAIADSQSSCIHIFDVKQSSGKSRKELHNIHKSPVIKMRYNQAYDCMISIDQDGIIEYWHTAKKNFAELTEPDVSFESKLDTDLYEYFAESSSDQKKLIYDLTISSDGQYFAVLASDRIITIFKFKKGKIVSRIDETFSQIEKRQKEKPFMNPIDFLRKMTIEKDLEKSNQVKNQKILFDQSGQFILYPSMEGIKVNCWRQNRLMKVYGTAESLRPIALSLFQGVIAEKKVTRFDTESLGISDPSLFCTAYKKNRFYIYSNRNFEDEVDEKGQVNVDRDIFNEPPTKEEILAAVDIEQSQRLIFENATIHTSVGDIFIKLFPNITPRTVENFCTHSKNNYYNGQIFHRIIKSFMIQTGDPTGIGTGGESIWGGSFEDEFDERVNFDEPYMVAMANCSVPNTNGSQFFITTVPCPNLHMKHTIFGKVVKGMDVCLAISKAKTDSKTDKPYADIKIININPY